MSAEPAALGSDIYSRLEGIAGIKSPSLPGSKNAGSNSENSAETKGLFSTSECSKAQEQWSLEFILICIKFQFMVVG